MDTRQRAREPQSGLPKFCCVTLKPVVFQPQGQGQYMLVCHNNCATQTDACSPTKWQYCDFQWKQIPAAELAYESTTGNSIQVASTGSDLYHSHGRTSPLLSAPGEVLPTQNCAASVPSNKEQHHCEPRKRSTNVDVEVHGTLQADYHLDHMPNDVTAASENFMQDDATSNRSRDDQDAADTDDPVVAFYQAPMSSGLYAVAPMPGLPTSSSKQLDRRPT